MPDNICWFLDTGLVDKKKETLGYLVSYKNLEIWQIARDLVGGT